MELINGEFFHVIILPLLADIFNNINNLFIISLEHKKMLFYKNTKEAKEKK
jgi:hypothetical protein